LCFLVGSLPAAEPADIEVAPFPRIAPRSPDESLASFRVAPGFRLELAAAEPLLADPVAMSFDEDGRLYVVEMCDYSERDQDRLGRVRRLEDTDGDGRYDRSDIYLDDLSWPTGVICAQGGVFVAAAPDILFAKDTNGDGQADERRVAFTGFGRGNVQGLVNSLAWGLDGRIYGATSASAGRVRRPEQPESAAIDLRGRDFAFDPRTLELQAVTGGGQHGLSFDDWGRRFVCSNSDHIRQVLLEDDLLTRNPWAPAPAPTVSIAADGPQAEVFRASPVEPWRIVRTRLRVAGKVEGPVEGGGRASGYFTSATGVTIYRGDVWPAEMRGWAVVADVGSNLVHRKRLVEDGLQLRAERVDENAEFIVSDDTWFRPVQFANGPDGALYMADLYREIVEHPDSLPPPIKQHLDLNAGNDRGRVYRIVTDGFRYSAPPKWSQASTPELVAALDSQRSWQRETVARLLMERGGDEAVPGLKTLLAGAKHPEARLQALYLLEKLGALSDEDLAGRLGDAHPRVRQHAVRLAEPRFARSAELLARGVALQDDADPNVRLELAFRLAGAPPSARTAPLVALAARDAGAPLMRFAVQTAVADSAAELLLSLLKNEELVGASGGRELIESLAKQVGGQGRQPELQTLAAACGGADSPASAAVLAGVISGLARNHREPLAVWRALGTDATALVTARLEHDRQTLFDRGQSEHDRRAALESVVRLSDYDRQSLLRLVDQGEPLELQRAALAAAGRSEPAGALAALLKLDSDGRAALFDATLAYPGLTAELARALVAKRLAWDELSTVHRQRLREHPDVTIRAAIAPLAKLEDEARASLTTRYRAALDLAGDVQRGRAAFRAHCATCHRLEGVGHEIGPPLAAIKTRGPEALLLAVLEPNREVNPQYVSYTITTNDGRVLTGLIASESSANIVLRRAEGLEDAVARTDVEAMTSGGRSLMPEGFEQQIDPQLMADLLAYLGQVQ
jgi:putative membrane-bound dehydrogenase-like protein